MKFHYVLLLVPLFSFFLPPSNLDANQQRSLLHHPRIELTLNSFQSSINLLAYSLLTSLDLSHHPLPSEILISTSRTMSHPLQLSLTEQRLDRLQTRHLQQVALRQSLVIRTPHYFPNQLPHQVPIRFSVDPLCDRPQSAAPSRALGQTWSFVMKATFALILRTQDIMERLP